jgi:alcohol dehydrogenase class IV
MGYYLTNYHEVHHGLANAVLLTHVLRFEGEYAKEKLERIALNLGVPDVPSLIDRVEEIADAVGIPRDLSELGVGASELDLMAKDAMTYSRNLDNNPVKVTEGDIRGIFAKALLGRKPRAHTDRA